MSDKQNRYWFKRRRFGWGWIPATWQAWLVIILWLSVVAFGIPAFLETPEEPAGREAAIYFLAMALATITLIRLGYAKGPKPRWRWGKKSNDDPEEDF